MTKGKQRQKVGGAVLVMVLIVMVVLIIMLMATLTVVTTAGQRIYTKYEENQAYYSARSALDIFTQNMLEDNSYYAYSSSGGIRQYTYTDSDGNVQTADMKQGLALQLELYKITSKGERTKEVAQSYKPAAYTDEATAREAIDYAENMDPGEIFASSTPEDSNFAISKTGSTTLDSITYTVTLPTLTDPRASGSDQSYYGEMVDKDASGNQIATIKVEVLDRLYDTGGAYAGNDDDIRRQIIDILNGTDSTAKTALMTNIKNGTRSKDRFKLKITSTVTYLGHEASAVLIYDTKERPVNNSSRALTTFGGSGSDNMNIIDGVSVRDDVAWSNDGVIYGNFYAEQNLAMNTGAEIWLTEGENFVVGNDLTISNANFKVKSYATSGDADAKPVVYIGGNLITGNMSASTFQDVDIILHGLQLTGNYFANTAGNVYCKGDFDLTGTTSDSTVDGDLYIEGDFIGSGASLTVNGDLYVKGNLNASAMKNLNVSGNVYIEGDVRFAPLGNGGNFYYHSDDSGKVLLISGVGGTVHIGGIKYDSSGVMIQSTDWIGVATLNNTNGGSQIDTSWADTLDSLDVPPMSDISAPNSGNETIEVELPDGVKKTIATHISNFNQYYSTDASGNLVDSSGNPINYSNPAPWPLPAPVSAETHSNKTSFVAPVGTQAIPSSVDGKRTIDTTSSTDNSYVLSADQNYGTIAVKGGGTVEFYLQNTAWDNQYEFIVDVLDNDTTVIFYGADTDGGADTTDWSYDYSFFNCKVLTPETKAALAGTELNVGSKEGCNIVVPNIHYYFSKDVEINIYNGGFYTGYFYAPDAYISSNAGATDIPLNYNGNSIGNIKITIVGSVLTNDIKFPNNNGVAYINPNLEDDADYGDPILSWSPYKYTRN